MKTYYLILFLFVGINSELFAQQEKLEVAAYTFAVQPKVGTPSGHTRTAHLIEEVYGDLKTTVLYFKQGENRFCMITSALGVESGALRKASVKILSNTLKIDPGAISASSSHNHTIPFLNVSDKKPDADSPQVLSWELGLDFKKKLQQAADYVSKNLEPVYVEWGKAEENRITYNRKGYYPNGKTYFMREEDRIKLAGEGYRGLIDPDAIVVVFKNEKHKAVAALTSFTGHPVAAYDPEKLISYGQFPQTASEMLSEHLGGVPVGFVQGCAGDINEKYMLSGTIEQARQLGEYLGETFIHASKTLRPSKRIGLEWSREEVKIPFAELPSEESLRKDLATIDDFIRRGNAGDENTLHCVGMNFPKALSPPYRAKLVELVRPWYVWALEHYEQDKLGELPEYLPIEIVVARFGDVGLVGLPYEPFVMTGLKIKQASVLPCVITGGYTDGHYGYIPDARGADDREYMSGFFRYKKNIAPYKAPAGDMCSEVAIEALSEFAR
ncbi:hypothetical protein [Catalinimonas alkaloidigena]|uniref:hypothetical protein n=1 Tax=Catalinimonas alkaloidigena TaxID=1075417 RepID=UPI0024065833|nr:hypothetical protein [Catalinimonas alkaloidigena]